MSIFEYDKEKEEKKIRKAEYATGEKNGRAFEIIQLGSEFGKSEAELLEMLQTRLSISKDEASKYMQQYYSVPQKGI